METDKLKDWSKELAECGRGSLMRKIEQLQAALDVATFTLDAISSGCHSPCNTADHAMRKIDKLLGDK